MVTQANRQRVTRCAGRIDLVRSRGGEDLSVSGECVIMNCGSRCGGDSCGDVCWLCGRCQRCGPIEHLLRGEHHRRHTNIAAKTRETWRFCLWVDKCSRRTCTNDVVLLENSPRWPWSPRRWFRDAIPKVGMSTDGEDRREPHLGIDAFCRAGG